MVRPLAGICCSTYLMNWWIRRVVLLCACLAAIAMTASSCSGSDGDSRDGGFRAGRFSKSVSLWVDADGPYTCPPKAWIDASAPAQCSADVGDRVRLRGDAVVEIVRTLDPPTPGSSTPYVRIKGRVDESGFEIEVYQAKVLG